MTCFFRVKDVQVYDDDRTTTTIQISIFYPSQELNRVKIMIAFIRND